MTTINPEVDPGTRNVRMRATVENPDGRLNPGMFASVVVQSGEKGLVQMNIPSNPVLATIILKRAQTQDPQMWTWHEAARFGEMGAARKSCSLVMFDASGKPVARYHLENAWPCKIELGALRAGSSEVLTETVTIVCDHLQRVAA